MDRREFLRHSVAVTGAGALGLHAGGALANPGQPVDKRELLTSTAQFDPARPEIAKLVAQACKAIGWEVNANPIDYNQGIQRVIQQHDFEMFLVALAGTAIRVDPQFFIRGVHHSGEHRKGGFNWMGYKSDRLDQLADAQTGAMELEARRKIVFDAQEVIFNDQPGTVLTYQQITMAHRSDKLKGLVPQLGEGIGSFWSDVNMEVIGGDGYSRTGSNVEIKHLNPVAVIDTLEFMEISMIYDRLFRIGPDGKPTPWAATALKVVNPTTVELSLRQGMKWHDGRPVTVQDVVFTFDYYKKWKAPFFLSELNNVEAVEAIDSRTFRVRLAKASAPFISNVLAAMFLLPAHVWKDIPGAAAGVDDPLKYPNETPIGSGPFKFEHWRRGSELKVSAFREHFNPPKCGGIIRVVYGSHDAIAAAIEKGDCDRSRYILSAALVTRLKGVKNVVAGGYPSHGVYHLSYNMKIKPFDDPAFRRAINHVMPREMISELVMLGYASPAGSVVSPANAFWHNAAVKPAAENVKQARDMLAKGGYNWDGQGRLLYPKA